MTTVQDLTVREVEEAKGFNITPDLYFKLQELFCGRLRQKIYDDEFKKVVKDVDALKKDIAKELRPGVREEITKELQANIEARYLKDIRPKLAEEVRAELRKELESAFQEEQRLKIRTEILNEIATTVPTVKQRNATREIIRERELEALTSARAASDLLEAEESSSRTRRRLGTITLTTLLLSVLPVLAYLHVVEKWAPTGVPFLAVAIPYALAIIMCGLFNSDARSKSNELIATYTRNVGEYRAQASKCKETWMVQVSTAATRGDLVALVQGLPAPDRYNSASMNTLPAAALEKARISVKDYLATDIDAERYLRTDTPDTEGDPPEVTAKRAS